MKSFTENDIYIITYINKNDNGGIDSDSIVILGEAEAHKHFDYVCKIEAHDEVILEKGIIATRLNNCIVPDMQIREWQKGR